MNVYQAWIYLRLPASSEEEAKDIINNLITSKDNNIHHIQCEVSIWEIISNEGDLRHFHRQPGELYTAL